MKKLLLASFVLLFFALTFTLVQTSCSKSKAQSISGSTLRQINRIVYSHRYGNGTEIWVANDDGTNKQKVNFILPAGLRIQQDDPRLSPDGSKVFFTLNKINFGLADGIYSCNIDGTNLTKVINTINTGDTLILGGVY